MFRRSLWLALPLITALLSGCSGCGARPDAESAAQLASKLDLGSVATSDSSHNGLPPPGSIQWSWMTLDRKLPWFPASAIATPTESNRSQPARNDSPSPITPAHGIAVIDFDGDGLPDLLMTDGNEKSTPADPGSESTRGARQRSVILSRARGDFRFDETTSQARLDHAGPATGIAAGDFDNDGFVDVFVAGANGGTLWRNCGDGTFEVHPLPRPTHPEVIGLGAAWGDLDGDGLLDLYVLRGPQAASPVPGAPASNAARLPADNAPGDLLYRNLGNGDFEICSAEAGIARVPRGPGAAVVIADLEGDGKLDLYATHEATPDFLFRNTGGMKFVEEWAKRFPPPAVEAETPSKDRAGEEPKSGSSLSSKGIAIGDYNRDGRFDLFLTSHEAGSRIFENRGEEGFHPVHLELGLQGVAEGPRGSGIVLLDFDMDGWPDLYIANEKPRPWLWENRPRGPRMTRPSLYINCRGKRLLYGTMDGGDYFHMEHRGQGVAWGDLDLDGAPDLVLGNISAPPDLLRNDSPREGSNVRLRFVGVRSARQPLGCRVEVHRLDGTSIAFPIPSGGSYRSSSSDVVSAPVGLGASEVREVRITWPDGRLESWSGLRAGRLHLLVEGTGRTTTADLPPGPKSGRE